jgi:acetyl/propionyl-CoA carboxylase alpha subunit
MIKARSGGGGRGIRMVRTAEDLAPALERTRAEAAATFGDDVVFLESLVSGGRHIEVQVMADGHGTVWAPGVRDCSVQRRNQKIVEESGSPVLGPEQVRSLREASTALVRAAGYRGAGTVEYLYQPQERSFAFMEVNTRLQVEHPVTEATTGLDLVKLQLLVAAGERLPDGGPPPELGHAVEVRLNAEDADEGFAPAPGTITVMTLPTGPGVRVDTGFAVGDAVSPLYDSMVAKVIAWGRDRPEAFARLRCALRDMTVLVSGGTTTKSFLLDLLARPEVVSGEADTQWLDRTGAGQERVPAPSADIALLSVAVDVYDEEEARERAAFLASARGGRPRADHAVGRPVELALLGRAYTFLVAQVGAGRYRVEVDGVVVDLDVDRRSDHERRLLTGGRRHLVTGVAGRGSHLVEVDGYSHRVVRDEAGLVRAPAPAVVVAVPVSAGDAVEAGATVVVLESMKMETAVRAPRAGTVREVLAHANSQVDAGAPLLRLDAADDGQGTADAAAVRFSDAQAATEGTVQPDGRDGAHGADRPGGVVASSGRALGLLTDLHALVTGYDISRERGGVLLGEYLAERGAGADVDPELLHRETALLTTFADLCDLSRNRPAAEEEQADEQVHSPREHLHSFLRSSTPTPTACPSPSGPAGARAAPLRGAGADPGSPAGGGRLPGVPGPAAGRRPPPGRHRPAGALAGRRRHPGATAAPTRWGRCWSGSSPRPS